MFLTLVIYLSFLVFFGVSLYKFRQLANMPMHGRLELYPVPKEPGAKGHYGGSYYEDVEWWAKPRQISHTGEMREMLKEMLFIKNLFVNQRKQWLLSYPMHLGFYLLALWTVLLGVGAGLTLAGSDLSSASAATASPLATVVYYATFISGSAGLALATLGSAGLFLRRLFSRALSNYTTPQEYFNLFFLLAVAASALVVWAGDPGFGYGREVWKGLLSFSAIQADAALTVHLLLFGALIIYIPFTKMSHYVGKYFSFHKVLWENEPNLKGSKMEQTVKDAMGYKPKTSTTWSAPHISGAAPKK